MDSVTLNNKIEEIHEKFPDLQPGEIIPYIGWFWRMVNFDDVITLGDCGTYVGFMENNKWDYPEWTVTHEQDVSIKNMIADVALDSDDTKEALFAIYEYIQSCVPKDESPSETRERAIIAVEENEKIVPSLESMLGEPLYKRI